LIQRGRPAHENLRQTLKQPPIPVLVGIGQVGSGGLASESHVIEQAGFGVETSDDVTETFPISQLSKTQGQEMVITSQSAGGLVAGKFLGDARKLRSVKGTGDLREQSGRWLHLPLYAKNTARKLKECKQQNRESLLF
jgi:hypothetical protein